MDIERREGRGLGTSCPMLVLVLTGIGERVEALEMGEATSVAVDEEVEGRGELDAEWEWEEDAGEEERYFAASGGSLYSGLPEVRRGYRGDFFDISLVVPAPLTPLFADREDGTEVEVIASSDTFSEVSFAGGPRWPVGTTPKRGSTGSGLVFAAISIASSPSPVSGLGAVLRGMTVRMRRPL